MTCPLELSRLSCYAVVIAVLALSGCGGSKILREPYKEPVDMTLASAADDQLEVSLDWVIIRDGPGAWASRADWDEYLFTVGNLSVAPVTITAVKVVDSLGKDVEPGFDRDTLVKRSRQVSKRYKEADIEIQAGMSGAGMFVTGTAVGLVGVFSAGGGVVGGLIGTGAGAVVAPAALGAVLAMPALIVGGAVRGINNTKVHMQIVERQTVFPYELAGKTNQNFNIFYPISPSPRLIEITYTGENGERTLQIDTADVLQGLHLEALEGKAETAAVQEP